MSGLRKTVLAVVLFLAIFFIPQSLTMTADAASTQPTAYDNLTVGLRSKSELVSLSSGYMRVYFNGEKICVEYLNSSFDVTSKKEIAMELDIWGGFYAGKNAYYVVEGKNNKSESDSAEVIRVIKYSTSWKKQGAAKIKSNGEVRYPFDYGCVEMTEKDGTLYVVTGHEGYIDPTYGQGHQGFLMLAVDESSMTGEIMLSNLGHSFAQYIEASGSYLYVLEQSEGSRATTLKKINADTSEYTTISVLDYGGTRTSAYAISCYASVDDMAISSKNVLCLGTSIDQSKYDSVTSSTAHNIYLTVTPKSGFSEDSTSVKWITSYSGGGKCFLGAKLTKISDSRFMISWEEYDTQSSASTSDTLSGSTLHYIFVDGSGNKIGKEYTASAPISDCHPIVKGSKVVYYASNGNMVNFYSINSSSGKFSKTVHRVAGKKATWKIKDGTLTFSGSGAISIDTDAHFRTPISSCSSMYSYSSSDNAWAPVRSSVKKIVIGNKITKIPASAFTHFDKLKEVTVGTGVTSIGKEAFAYCSNLKKITIPDSVTKIGDDILWTGYTWSGTSTHVVYATIYCYTGSKALSYAKKNNISYKKLKAKVDTTYTVGKYKYKVTDASTDGTGKVTLTKVVTKASKVTIPATVKIYGIKYKVTAIKKNAFKSNKKITTLSIGKNVSTIGTSAFQKCTKLKSVTGGASLKKIGDSAFKGCTKLSSFTSSSKKLTTIGKSAFSGDKKLAKITLKTTKLKSSKVGKNAFKNIKSTCTFKVPSSKVSSYKSIFRAKGAGKKIKVKKNK